MESLSNDGLTNITHLTEDCLNIIFQFLDSRSDRESFGLTCRLWLEIQNRTRRSLEFLRPFIYDFFYPTHIAARIEAAHLHRLLSRFPRLTTLSLLGCSDQPDSALIPLHFYGSQLRSLYLDHCSLFTDAGLHLIATSCPLLTVVSLYSCNMTDRGLRILATNCPSLKRINLSFCHQVTDSGLGEISRKCSQLVAVKLLCCPDITGVGFTGCPPTLTHVDAELSGLEPEGIAALVSGGGLEFLNLQNIDFPYYDNGVAYIGSGFAARLKILNMGGCDRVGDVAIMAISKGCPLLEEWNLAYCDEVRLAGWEAIGAYCNRLEELHVNKCGSLGDLGLEALERGCGSLKVLYMSESSGLSGDAILRFRSRRRDVEIRYKECLHIGPDWTDGME